MMKNNWILKLTSFSLAFTFCVVEAGHSFTKTQNLATPLALSPDSFLELVLESEVISQEDPGLLPRSVSPEYVDIGLNRLGFNLDWGSREDAIKSARWIIARKQQIISPDIIAQHAMIDEETSEDELDELRRKIYSITPKHLRLWFVESHLRLNRYKEYFDGDPASLLLAIFDNPRLNLERDQFKETSAEYNFTWAGKSKGFQIANVRKVLESHRSDLLKDYEEIKKMGPTDERELKKAQLRRKIYKINSEDFRFWGIYKTIKDSPHFKNQFPSYIKALQEVFNELDLQPFEFSLFWTEELALASLEYVFNREIPEIMSEFERFKAGELDETGIHWLRSQIYKIRLKHLKVWGAQGATVGKSLSFFKSQLNEKEKEKFKNMKKTHVVPLLAFFKELELNSLGFKLDPKNPVDSIRFIISTHFPESRIIERYDALGTNSSLKEYEALRKEVYSLKSTSFPRKVGNLLESFDYSYIKALETVFEKLQLEPLEFKLDFSSPERSLDSVRFKMFKEMPHLRKAYEALSDQTPAGDIERLRNMIYQIKEKHVKHWGIANKSIKKHFTDFAEIIFVIFSEKQEILKLDPSVMRSRRGMVLRYWWTGKSSQKHEKNVYDAIQENRPDIIEAYEALDEESPEADKDRLLKEIYAITRSHFDIWGISGALKKDRVPSFRGSHRIALQNTFSKLDFNLLEFGPDWTDPDTTKDYFMFIFNKKIPSIMKTYSGIDWETVEKRELEALRHQIYTITKEDFIDWGLISYFQSREMYLGKTSIEVLQAIFPKLDLNPLGFQGDHSTPQRAIETLWYQLLKYRPEIVKAYRNRHNLSEAELIDLQEQIYEIDSSLFGLWFSSKLIKKHFDNSYTEALLTLFDSRKTEAFLAGKPESLTEVSASILKSA